MALEIKDVPNEKSSGTLTFKLRDKLDDGTYAVIPASYLVSATMSLRDALTGTVINSRTAVDVKQYFDSQGVFFFKLTDLDNAIINPTVSQARETHIATFDIVANRGDGTQLRLTEELIIFVRNLRFIA